MERYVFDYYYGLEADQFSFFRIPRLLIKDKRFSGLSNDAKLLYGLLLDRLALSRENGWIDGQNRVYIKYSVAEISKDLNIGRDKAMKLLAQLDTKKGIGLIERIRVGQGCADTIYVKNFASAERDAVDAEPVPRPHDNSEVGKCDFRKSDRPILRGRKSRLQEVGEIDPNYTDKNNNYGVRPINQSALPAKRSVKKPAEPQPSVSVDRGKVTEEEVRELIQDNVEYETIVHDGRYKKEIIDELVELMVEVIVSRREKFRISGVDVPYNAVRSRFEKIDYYTMLYVLEALEQNSARITNIRAYMLAVLYNAPVTVENYYSQETKLMLISGAEKQGDT